MQIKTGLVALYDERPGKWSGGPVFTTPGCARTCPKTSTAYQLIRTRKLPKHPNTSAIAVPVQCRWPTPSRACRLRHVAGRPDLAEIRPLSTRDETMLRNLRILQRWRKKCVQNSTNWQPFLSVGASYTVRTSQSYHNCICSNKTVSWPQIDTSFVRL